MDLFGAVSGVRYDYNRVEKQYAKTDRQTSETGRQADQAVVTVNGKLHGIANKRMHRIHVHP